jgi:hypothetical protein
MARQAGLTETKAPSGAGETGSSFGGSGVSAPVSLGCGLRILGGTSVSARSEWSRSNQLWSSDRRQASGMSGSKAGLRVASGSGQMSSSADSHRTSVRRADGGAGSTSPSAELRLRRGRAHVGPKEAFGLGREDDHSVFRGLPPGSNGALGSARLCHGGQTARLVPSSPLVSVRRAESFGRRGAFGFRIERAAHPASTGLCLAGTDGFVFERVASAARSARTASSGGSSFGRARAMQAGATGGQHRSLRRTGRALRSFRRTEHGPTGEMAASRDQRQEGIGAGDGVRPRGRRKALEGATP